MIVVYIIVLIGERPLGNNLAAIDSLVDVVNRHPENLHPILHGTLHRAGSLKSGKQRRVYVDNTTAVTRQQRIGNNTHISGQTNQIDITLVQKIGDGTLHLGLRRERLRVESKSLHAVECGAFHNPGRRLVANHRDHIGRNPTLLASYRYRFEITASSTGKYGNSFFV